MRFFRSKVTKFVSVFVAITILTEAVFPSVALALTSGPKSPEFMSFTPVATTNMVDLVTGDFNYNIPVVEIPGSDGGGYALSLAYNSGVNSEQEASWVGFGWSLNPGSIDRNTRGIPDDYNNTGVITYNKSLPNLSMSGTSRAGIEIFSKKLESSIGGISIGRTLRFNNLQGFMVSTNLGFTAMGQGLNMSMDPNGTTFSAHIGVPMNFVAKKIGNYLNKKLVTKSVSGEVTVAQANAICYVVNAMIIPTLNHSKIQTGLFTYSDAPQATTYKSYSGFSINLSKGIQFNPTPAQIGVNVGFMGNVNVQYGTYSHTSPSYGFLNEPLEISTDCMMDYYIEKDGDFNKRDIFIGMPFSNPDIFSVTGEGVSGGFRAFRNSAMLYRPSKMGSGESSSNVYSLGIDVNLVSSVGVGLDIGFGKHKTTLSDWGTDFEYENSPGYTFRFNNDLGGAIEYGESNNDLVTASLEDFNCDASGVLSEKMIALKAKSAAYISAKRFDDNNTLGVPQKAISGFSIYNEGGDNYLYGVPVLVKNETSLSVNASKSSAPNGYIARRAIPLIKKDGGYVVTSSSLRSSGYTSILGEIKQTPYAGSYLLKQITKANYIDVGGNGPDANDFGGWTKFDYRTVHSGDHWYKYRSPYRGAYYEQNSISDKRDDFGSVSTGEKEVKYLSVIETKTHIAFFVTNKYVHDEGKYPGYKVGNGSGIARPDGRGSAEESPTLAGPPSRTEIERCSQVERLERIVLFSKARPDKPIKTVFLEYDNSLVPQLPNNVNTYAPANENNKQTGKLTLKRVWFEYEGVASAKISPYEFFYAYPKVQSIEAGKEFFEEYSKLPEVSQNPNYAPELLDPWGNIMAYGKERKRFDIPWIYQGDSKKSLGFEAEESDSWRRDAKDIPFDPAAWHLKKIKLPSGGEIHIQYEQKDYSYVQDRPVMAMASLVDAENGYDKASVDVNVDDLGCDPSNADQVKALVEEISQYFTEAEGAEAGTFVNKVYFKFLYSLLEKNPSLNNSNSEYITGYSKLVNVERISVGNKYAIRLTLGSEKASDGERTITPRQGAYDFFINKRQGLLTSDPYNLIQTASKPTENAAINFANKDGVPSLKDLASFGLGVITIMAESSVVVNKNKYKVGQDLSHALSFVKLPMLGAKRGGGARVKRLLMYDSGIEAGDAHVLGQEYHYVLEDGKSSSGVATNEPSGAREENPLVQYMVRGDQSKFSRLTVGEDKDQTEGPIGESLLPAAAVYFSRVVVENIHSNKSLTGFTVHEYFTTKDYPFDMNYGEVAKKVGNSGVDVRDIVGSGVDYTDLSDNMETDNIPEISMLLFSFKQQKVAMTQGFRFILNSMNGMTKSVAAYGGKYNDSGIGSDISLGYLVNRSEYEYYEPGEKVELLMSNGKGGFFRTYAVPGKETDIAVEGKRLKETAVDFSLEFDLTLSTWLIPIPFVGAFPSMGFSNESVATYATTKVLRYPTILKSETTYSDGQYSKTEYLAFNETNGKPIVTRTTDGFSKKPILGNDAGIYQFSVPASWRYDEMGQKSVNVLNTNQLSASTMEFVTYGNRPDPSWFEVGGLINGVISASQVLYKDGWVVDEKIASEYGVVDCNMTKKLWLPYANYVYKSTQLSPQINGRVYDRGHFNIAKTQNWWDNLSSGWMKLSEVTLYSPNGDPLEEYDAMGIPSAVIYGKQYMHALPTMLAQNAPYSDIYFNDFEGAVDQATEPVAHSGRISAVCDGTLELVPQMKVSEHMKETGGILKFWANSTNGISNINFNGNKISAKRVATCGNWSLYEAILTGVLLNQISLVSIQLESNKTVNVDDVRFQPIDAQATCNVYDTRNFKLLTQFDDQHFGVYYTYNDEGMLTRKSVETERGKKTIQENQYSIPRVKR